MSTTKPNSRQTSRTTPSTSRPWTPTARASWVATAHARAANCISDNATLAPLYIVRDASDYEVGITTWGACQDVESAIELLEDTMAYFHDLGHQIKVLDLGTSCPPAPRVSGSIVAMTVARKRPHGVLLVVEAVSIARDALLTDS